MRGYPVISVIVVVIRSPADEEENHWENEEDNEDGAGVDVDGEDGETRQWSRYWGGRGEVTINNNKISQILLVNTGMFAWNIFKRETETTWWGVEEVEDDRGMLPLCCYQTSCSAVARPDQWLELTCQLQLCSHQPADSWHQPQLGGSSNLS